MPLTNALLTPLRKAKLGEGELPVVTRWRVAIRLAYIGPQCDNTIHSLRKLQMADAARPGHFAWAAISGE